MIISLNAYCRYMPCTVTTQALDYLIHDQNTPKSSLPIHHVLVRLIRLVEGKLLNHTIDVVELRESYRLFAGEGCPSWPSMNGQCATNEWRSPKGDTRRNDCIISALVQDGFGSHLN